MEVIQDRAHNICDNRNYYCRTYMLGYQEDDQKIRGYDYHSERQRL